MRWIVSNEKRRLQRMAHLAGNGEILDIGCAALPNVHLRGRTVVGLDRERWPRVAPYTEALAGDVDDLPGVLGPRRFDAIVAGEVLEHLENPYRFVRDCREALRPGGRLVLSTPNPLHPPVLLCEALGIRRLFYTEEHLYYFLPRWVRRLVEASGMQLEKQEGVGFPLLVGSRPALPAPVALSYQVIYVARKPG